MRLFRSMTRAQRLWLVLAATAWLIESYDIGLVSVVLVPFKKLWHLTASDVGLLVASATVGIVLGVVPAGFLADRLGRKRMMVGALAFYSVITALTALAPDWHAVLGLRLLAGIGLGAMFPLPYTLLTELSPPTARGAVAGLLDAFLSVGYFFGALSGRSRTDRIAAGRRLARAVFGRRFGLALCRGVGSLSTRIAALAGVKRSRGGSSSDLGRLWCDGTVGCR